MYSTPNRPTRFVRTALPAIAAACFLQGSLLAQLVDFDTRYRTHTSSNHWQSPPALNVQPSPWHGSQAFPPGFHQLNTPQAGPLPNHPIAQPFQNHQMIPVPMVGSEYPMQMATPVLQQAQGIVLSPHAQAFPMEANISGIPMESNISGIPMESNISGIPMESNISGIPMESNISGIPMEANISGIPMESEIQALPLGTNVPSAEIPLGTNEGTEIGSTVPTAQAIPEGYDPAYPIEYPGEAFKGYYPTDGGVIAPPTQGGVIAPPSETAIQTSPDSTPNGTSTEPLAPAIPSVVIEDADAGIVMPETAANENGLAQTIDVLRMTKAPETPAVSRDSVTGSEDGSSANKMAMKKAEREAKARKAERDTEARMVKKLKQQMRAAELRAREAEEKVLAIARRSSADQKTVDQLKAKLAESNKALNQMKSQSAQAKQQLEKARKAAPVIELERLEKARKAAAKASPENKVLAAPVIELEPPAQPKAKKKSPEVVSPKSPRANPSDKESLNKKIGNLETAREKQLAAAAERIKADFKAKIDAKLDSGKTTEHPEVLILKDSLQKRLNQSDKNIRVRYKRQINKLRKEAAARSRS